MVVIETKTRMSFSRKLFIVLVALALLVTAWIFYDKSRMSEAPSRSTTESRPNSPQNVPNTEDGSVTGGGNEADPTTPSRTGTGANTLLSQ